LNEIAEEDFILEGGEFAVTVDVSADDAFSGADFQNRRGFCANERGGLRQVSPVCIGPLKICSFSEKTDFFRSSTDVSDPGLTANRVVMHRMRAAGSKSVEFLEDIAAGGWIALRLGSQKIVIEFTASLLR